MGEKTGILKPQQEKMLNNIPFISINISINININYFFCSFSRLANLSFALFWGSTCCLWQVCIFQQFMLFVSLNCKASSHFIAERCRPSYSQGFLLCSLNFALLGLGLVLALPSKIWATLYYSWWKFYVHNSIYNKILNCDWFSACLFVT